MFSCTNLEICSHLQSRTATVPCSAGLTSQAIMVTFKAVIGPVRWVWNFLHEVEQLSKEALAGWHERREWGCACILQKSSNRCVQLKLVDNYKLIVLPETAAHTALLVT